MSSSMSRRVLHCAPRPKKGPQPKARSRPPSQTNNNSDASPYAAPQPLKRGGAKPDAKSFKQRLAIKETSRRKSPPKSETAPGGGESNNGVLAPNPEPLTTHDGFEEFWDPRETGDGAAAKLEFPEKKPYKVSEPPPPPPSREREDCDDGNGGDVTPVCKFHADDGGRGVASSLAEYYLSGGKMVPPAFEDFTGPVKISKVEAGRGRGLVLLGDVAAGDLLFVSNPIAKVCKVETEVAEGARPLETGCWTGSQVLADQLVSILSARAWRSSHDREMLATLCSHGGEDLPIPPPALFRRGRSGGKGDPPPLPGGGGLAPFDRSEVARICGVVQCNAFGHTGVTRKNEREITRSWSCGIWVLPSFMNHSCVPNVATVVVGDAMVAVATRALRGGDELTVAYFDIFRPLQERRTSMLHSWRFVCACPRCALEEGLRDALDLVAHAYGCREAAAAAALQALHAGRGSGGPAADASWSPYSVIDLAQLAEYIEKVLHHEPGLSRVERNWVRASFLSAYLADGKRLMVDVKGLEEPRQMKHVRKTHIQIALAAAESVTPGHPQTLQIAAVLQERAIHSYGKHSFLVKKATQRALNVCMHLFGHQSEAALQKIVAAAAMDVLSSSVIFLSRP